MASSVHQIADVDGHQLLVVLHGAGKGGYWDLEERVTKFAQVSNQYNTMESKGGTWDFIHANSSHDTMFIQHAINQTRKGWSVSDHRIALKGISDGGSMALSIVTSNRTLFQACLSISAGFCVLDKKKQQQSKDEKKQVEDEIQRKEQDSTEDGGGGPMLLLLHGENDTLFPLEKVGRSLENKLKTAGYSVRFQVGKGDGHVPDNWRGCFIKEWLDLP